MLDWTRMWEAVREAGYDPDDPGISYESYNLSLDGSKTVSAYLDGKHIASAFVGYVRKGE